MELKKNPKIDLRKKRPLFLAAGYVVATAFSLAAFEWKTFYEFPIDGCQFPTSEEVDIFDPIEITYHKPAPPKQKVVTGKVLPPVIDTRIVETKLDPIIEPKLILPEIDIDFKIDDLVTLPPMKAEEEEEDLFVPFPEKWPVYPGGDPSLMKFFGDNTRYPSIARENGIEGVVFVSYVVETDGSVSEVKIKRGVDHFLNKEALRVVSLLDGYEPGMQGGKPVRVPYVVPIRFQLN